MHETRGSQIHREDVCLPAASTRHAHTGYHTHTVTACVVDMTLCVPPAPESWQRVVDANLSHTEDSIRVSVPLSLSVHII